MIEQQEIRNFAPEEIAAFWEQNPCGGDFVEFHGEYKRFFEEYDAFRYRELPYILPLLDRMNLRGKEVLEIGTGQGADAQQIIQRGGHYTGVDITEESIRRLRTRFEAFNLPYRNLFVENAEKLSLPDEAFDIVYSNGVFLTSPRIKQIVAHTHRVLKPGGQAIVMLYHKDSLNYHVSIKMLRRLGIFLLYVPFVDRFVSRVTNEPLARLNKHKANLRDEGLGYLKMENFIHKATDGPDNVYSSVWTKEMCDDLFAGFSDIKYEAWFINERHFPVVMKLLPQRAKDYIENRWGWNLILTATK